MDWFRKRFEEVLGQQTPQRPQQATVAQPAQQNILQMINGHKLPPRGQVPIRQRPFQMFEDGSFQGNPARLDNPILRYEDGSQGPRFKFYEDNSFADYSRPRHPLY